MISAFPPLKGISKVLLPLITSILPLLAGPGVKRDHVTLGLLKGGVVPTFKGITLDVVVNPASLLEDRAISATSALIAPGGTVTFIPTWVGLPGAMFTIGAIALA